MQRKKGARQRRGLAVLFMLLAVAGPPRAQVLELTGNFEPGAAAAFEQGLTPEVRTVVLRVNGGYLTEGIEIGRIIRARGLRTVVPEGARCLSACAEAFLGGVQREIAGVVAFHIPRASRFSSKQEAFNIGYAGGALVVIYRFEMGFGFDLSNAINRWTDEKRLLAFMSTAELEAYRRGRGGLPRLVEF